MKTSTVASALALAASASATEQLLNIPVGLCAGILGEASCNQLDTSPGGLINVPVNTCIAALGEVKCNQAHQAANDQGSLINVPINVCLAVLGEAACQQQSSSSGGLVNIPINLCLAVLGETECNSSGQGNTATIPAPTSSGPSGPDTTPVGAGTSTATQVPNGTPTGPAGGPTGSATGTGVPVPGSPNTTPSGPQGTATPTGANGVLPSVSGTSVTVVPSSQPYPSSSAVVPGASSTVVIGQTSTVIVCPGEATSTLVPVPKPNGPNPSGPAQPTGVLPRPSSVPSNTPSTPFTAGAGRFDMSALTVMVGAAVALAFNL